MTVIINESNLCGKRFDFGVPLEDVFPSKDIHPRLKYIFEKGYSKFSEAHKDLATLFRITPGLLGDCFKLKEILIYDTHYYHSDFQPGVYFWLLRHFLGLLPIPLLPQYSNSYDFDWKCLSERCRAFFDSYVKGQKRYQLDYMIAKQLNLLPFEHFLLLKILITLLRKVSQKSDKCVRLRPKSLLFVAEYYSASISTRPYISGRNIKQDAIFPLLFYLLLRWLHIQKLCKKLDQPTFTLDQYYLSDNVSCKSCSKSVIDDDTRRSRCNRDIIITHKNVACENRIHLKDTECKTKKLDICEKEVQISEGLSSYYLKGILTSNTIKPIAHSTILIEPGSDSEDLKSTCDNRIYLKDTECQTDKLDVCEKSVQIAEGLSSYYSKGTATSNTIQLIAHSTLLIEPENENEDLRNTSDKIICLKGSDCQTEKLVVCEKGIQIPEDLGSYYLNEFRTSNTMQPIAHSTVLIEAGNEDINSSTDYHNNDHEFTFVTAVDYTVDKDEIPLEEEIRKSTFNNNRTNNELHFFSLVDSGRSEDWHQIKNETEKTVKKIDEYIYDDYETFKKEDFNQIGTNLSSVGKCRSSVFDRISKIGWTYTPPKNSSRLSEDPGNDDSFHKYSYYKFDEVDNQSTKDEDKKIEEKCLNVNLSCANKFEKNETTFKNRRKAFFKLKRFKINLDFLRLLTKRDVRPNVIYENESNVKYIRMKNSKANTL